MHRGKRSVRDRLLIAMKEADPDITYAELGEHFDVSRQRAHQIVSDARREKNGHVPGVPIADAPSKS